MFASNARLVSTAVVERLGTSIHGIADTSSQTFPMTTMHRFQQAVQAASASDSRDGNSDSLLPMLQEASGSVNTVMQ